MSHVSIPISIVTPAVSAAGCQPIAVGVPAPRGLLSGREALVLNDEQGRTLPVQVETLARWPDESCQWLLVEFLWPLSPDDPPVRQVCLETADQVPQCPAAVIVRCEDDRFLVDTGDAALAVFRRGDVLLKTVRVGSAFLTSPPSLHAVLTDARGRRIVGETRHVVVESRGPLRATLRLEGRLGRQLRWLARFDFFAGSGLVRLRWTVHNPRRARHAGNLWDLGDSGSVLLEDFSLRWTMSQTVRRAFWKSESDRPAETISVDQESLSSPGAEVEAGNLVEIHQNSSGGENWQSPNHVNRHAQVPCRFRGYRVQVGAGMREGLRASPIVAAEDGRMELAVAMPEFWQQFPKTMAVDAEGIRIGLFPREANDLFELQGGEQKTHSVWFLAAAKQGADVANALEWVDRPARAIASPAWSAQSRAMPYLVAADGKTDPRYHAMMDAAIDGPESFLAKRESIDEYGWRHYGEVVADHENAYAKGLRPVISHYNNQFDVVYGAILQAMRAGDTRWVEIFEPLARHVIDIDIYHTLEDRAAYRGGLFWHTDHYRSAETATHRTYSRINVRGRRGSYGGGPACEHNYTSGLLHYYYLTGDRQALEAVIGLADWVLAMDDGTQTILGLIDDGATGLASSTFSRDYHGPGRGAGNSIQTLLDAWLASGCRLYLEKAESLIRRTIHPDDDPAERDLLDVERRWSYTVHLAALARYLELKIEQGERDFMYAYARAGLLGYARWMLANERPYFDRPGELEYPTETWAAQEFRKANVLRLAARHAEEPLRSRLLARGDELARRAWHDLERFSSRHVARAVAILMTEGMRDGYFRATVMDSAPAPEAQCNFGRPEIFVPQRQRVVDALKTPAGFLRILKALASPGHWNRIRRLWPHRSEGTIDMFSLFAPHLRMESVLELTPARLRRLEIDALLLDVDCTLKNYRADSVDPKIAAWLDELRAAGIGLCLISNGRGRRISPLAASLGIPCECEACKPLPWGCRRAIRRLGFDPKRTAMVGDQLFADIMAGRLAGLLTVLVRPMQPEEEPWFTQLKRPLERVLLQRMDRRGRP